MRVESCIAVLTAVLTNVAPASAQPHPSGCGIRCVAVIVDPALVTWIRSGLDQFENDLCAAGYATVEHATGFADPPALRAHLAGLRQQPGRNLAGAILIGDLPRVYQFVSLSGVSPIAEEVISFQYYADLDGTFTRSAGYTSPGGHPYSYDQHGGNVAWEIWVGLLPVYKGDLQATASAVNRYFAKNHAYRTGLLQRPGVYLQVSEHFVATTLAEHDALLGSMRSGAYAWTPYSNGTDARLYFDSPPAGLSAQQGYDAMMNGMADFTVTQTHGTWMAAGHLTISSVESSPVKTVFFWGDGCAIGNLDHPDNFLTSILFSPTSDVLVAKGTTNNSGGLGTNANGFFGHNIATALSAGASFGDAVLQHVNVPLVSPWSASREFHLATAVLLGDLTLERTNAWREQEPYTCDCRDRPAGTVCARFNDGYVWLVRDAIRGWETRTDGGATIQTAVGSSGTRYEHFLGTGSVRVVH